MRLLIQAFRLPYHRLRNVNSYNTAELGRQSIGQSADSTAEIKCPAFFCRKAKVVRGPHNFRYFGLPGREELRQVPPSVPPARFAQDCPTGVQVS